jgi:hypothetical protein
MNKIYSKEEINDMAYEKIKKLAVKDKYKDISIASLLSFAEEYNEIAQWQGNQLKRIKEKK